MIKNIDKKTILVIGGAGFIGSHLCEYFVKNGHKVISLDNYFTGSEKNHIDEVEYIKGETKDIKNLIKRNIDTVYHLGEYSRVLTSFEDINLVWRLNVLGTFRVIEFCKNNNVRLIYAGSSTKFGEFEDGGSGQNKSPYAYFKSTNTNLINNYSQWFNLNYAIVYFYNVYGGREIKEGKYATLIGIFTKKSQNKEPLEIVSPGTQKRAFTHIDDTIHGLALVGEIGNGDGYCIGSKKEYSILEVAKMFGGKIKMIPGKKGDRNFSKINLTKINKLGWKPKKNLKDYIESIKN